MGLSAKAMQVTSCVAQDSSAPARKAELVGRQGPFSALPACCTHQMQDYIWVQEIKPEGLGQIKFSTSENEGASEKYFLGFTATMQHVDITIVVCS